MDDAGQSRSSYVRIADRASRLYAPAVHTLAVLAFAGWRLDLDKRELTAPDGVLVALSAGEFGLLAALTSHPQRVLSRDQLLDLARGREAQAFDRSIDVQVSRLRRKIEADPREPTLIKTVRGGGYLFTSKVEPQ